ncbi:hypothetical protein [Streptomyces sp. NPDC058667]|uniref:hypothetical protein n=1 Tax=Streptomyces sp. NPDC058667 TaxID=3346588 RepID=UPI003646C246
MPSFVIVTVDGTTYQEGEPAEHSPALAGIGAGEQVLESFVYVDGDVVLRYGSYRLRIPQTRIDCIAHSA